MGDSEKEKQGIRGSVGRAASRLSVSQSGESQFEAEPLQRGATENIDMSYVMSFVNSREDVPVTRVTVMNKLPSVCYRILM